MARSLRWLLLLALVALVGGVMYSLLANVRVGPRASAAPAEEPVSAANRVAQRADNVEIVRTRRGAPTLRLKAAESTTYASGRLSLASATFRLYGPDGQETVVEAPSAEMTPAADASAPPVRRFGASQRAEDEAPQGIGSWLLTGGVKVAAADGLTLAMPTLRYDEKAGEARTEDPVAFSRGVASGTASGMVYDVASQIVRFPLQVTASMPLGGMGVVKVEAASATHDLGHRTFEMRTYHAVTQRGETLAGAKLVARFRDGESGLDRFEGDEGFVLESTHAITLGASDRSPLAQLLALEGARTMRGQRLAMIFDGHAEPTSLEVSGDANLAATNVQGKGPSSIAAQTLVFDLTQGTISRARATGAVDLQGAPAEGQTAGFRLRSNYLEAVLDPNLGSIRNLEGTGEIQLTDQDMQSQGNRTVLDPNADIVTLTGREGEPAVATWLDRRIQALRIDADRKRKTLTARGGVRASYQPPADQPGAAGKGEALPFFRGGETVYAMAGSLLFADQGRVAKYRERVRLWQGDNRVEAAEVDINENSGTLEARTEVISTFRQPPPAADANQPAAPHNPSDDIVTVSAASMKYDRAAGTIVYTGRVLVTQGTMRVTSDNVTVTLAPDGGSADRMEAVGSVETREQGRRGHGDRLIVDLKANTLRLSGSGREAVVQDETGQQVVRGSALTMDRTGDKILVESELGGRTWITLKPRQKGASGLGSDPPN